MQAFGKLDESLDNTVSDIAYSEEDDNGSYISCRHYCVWMWTHVKQFLDSNEDDSPADTSLPAVENAFALLNTD